MQDSDEQLPDSAEGSVGYGKPGWIPAPLTAAPGNTYNVTLGALYPYVKSAGVYVCPDDSYGRGLSYTMNSFLGYQPTTMRAAPTSLAQIDASAATILLVDEQLTVNDGNFNACGDSPTRVHTNGVTLAYMDGHAKWLRPEKLQLSDYMPYGSYVLPAGCTGVVIPPPI